jgi:hypothetical protein
MKNRKVIASLLVVAATCCFLFLRVVVQAAEHAKAEGAHDLVSRDNAGPLLRSKQLCRSSTTPAA